MYRKIEELFLSLTTYPADSDIADLAGRYLRESRRRGRTLELADALIAATSVHHGLTLMTYHVTHYHMVDIKLA